MAVEEDGDGDDVIDFGFGDDEDDEGDEEDEDHLSDEEDLVALAELGGVGDFLHDGVDVERLVAVAVAGGHGEREPSRAIVTYEDWGGPEGWSASDEDDRGGNARGSGRTSARASRPGANPGGARGREGSDGRRRHRCADRPWCGSRLCLTLDRSDATCAIILHRIQIGDWERMQGEKNK